MASTFLVLFALCGSVLGKSSSYNSTKFTCESSDDCGAGKVCIDFNCEFPCLDLCGPNTICFEAGEVSLCSCQLGFTGQPFDGCYHEECAMNSNCPPEKVCSDRQCKDACKDACGPNSVCKAAKHRPVCSCSLGYVWKPLLGCQIKKIKECTRDPDCPSDRICSNDECVDPCIGVCGNNTVCKVVNHRPACACKSGFFGDPFLECLVQNTSIPITVPEKKKKKYFFGTDQVNWYTAVEICQSTNKQLASITSAEEQAEIQELVHKRYFDEGYSSSWLMPYIWTSGSDLNRKGHYVWNSTGQSFDYTNWSYEEPEVSDKYRCVLFRSHDYAWMTGNCSGLFHYVCEYF